MPETDNSQWSEAKLDSFVLAIQDIDDGFDKALAIYEYPFADGAALQDMGMSARSIRFRAYWWDETYADHKDFLDQVAKDAVNELQHPSYGLLKGRVKRVSVKHDDRLQTAEADIEFIEQKQGLAPATSEPAVVAATEGAVVAGQPLMESAFIQAMQNFVSAVEGAAAIAETVLDEAQSAISQIQGIAAKAQEYVAKIDTAVGDLENTLAAIENPVESVLSTVQHAATLPGRVVKAAARAVERIAQSVGPGEGPARFVAGFTAGVASLRVAVPDLAPTIACAGALHGSMVMAQLLQADEDTRRAALAKEGVRAVDDAGNVLVDEPLTYPATIDELERSLEAMRTAIQEAIDLDRSNTALKATALALLRHVNRTKLERERLVVVNINRPTPLHLICHQYGLPFTAADRIMALNPHIKNPSFVEGELRIYG